MIKVYDDFLDNRELVMLSDALVRRHWFFIDDYKDTSQRFNENRTLGVVKENPNDFDDFDFFLISKIKEKLGFNLNLKDIRILMNCFKVGDVPTLHTDNLNNSPTFLFFLNPKWKWWWGSGLLVCEKNKKRFVKVKPGRLVIFDGSSKHKAIPPNFLYKGIGRFSYAIQYQQHI